MTQNFLSRKDKSISNRSPGPIGEELIKTYHTDPLTWSTYSQLLSSVLELKSFAVRIPRKLGGEHLVLE